MRVFWNKQQHFPSNVVYDYYEQSHRSTCVLPDTVGICSLTTNRTRRFHERWDVKMLPDVIKIPCSWCIILNSEILWRLTNQQSSVETYIRSCCGPVHCTLSKTCTLRVWRNNCPYQSWTVLPTGIFSENWHFLEVVGINIFGLAYFSTTNFFT